jgi:hypothetical protein
MIQHTQQMHKALTRMQLDSANQDGHASVSMAHSEHAVLCCAVVSAVLLLVLCKDPEAVPGAAAFCGPGLLLSTAWLRSPSAQRDCASEIVQRGCTPVY